MYFTCILHSAENKSVDSFCGWRREGGIWGAKQPLTNAIWAGGWSNHEPLPRDTDQTVCLRWVDQASLLDRAVCGGTTGQRFQRRRGSNPSTIRHRDDFEWVNPTVNPPTGASSALDCPRAKYSCRKYAVKVNVTKQRECCKTDCVCYPCWQGLKVRGFTTCRVVVDTNLLGSKVSEHFLADHSTPIGFTFQNKRLPLPLPLVVY